MILAGHKPVEQLEHRRAVGEAQHFLHLRGRDGVGTQRDRLVEERQPVADRAVGGTRDDADRFRFDGNLFALGDIREMRRELVDIEPAQVEALAARQNRHRNLADLRRREDETNVLGRLFQRLQQRVEGVLREHVHFVDDVDLEACG